MGTSLILTDSGRTNLDSHPLCLEQRLLTQAQMGSHSSCHAGRGVPGPSKLSLGRPSDPLKAKWPGRESRWRSHSSSSNEIRVRARSAASEPLSPYPGLHMSPEGWDG